MVRVVFGFGTAAVRRGVTATTTVQIPRRVPFTRVPVTVQYRRDDAFTVTVTLEVDDNAISRERNKAFAVMVLLSFTVAISRVMVKVYVFVVTPSCAVVRSVMTFDPTVRAILADALPDDTKTPFTRTVAVRSTSVGITFVERVPFGTVLV